VHVKHPAPYNCISQAGPTGSKHVETPKIKNYNINLEEFHFLVYIVQDEGI
jgi:hypothetical protein